MPAHGRSQPQGAPATHRSELDERIPPDPRADAAWHLPSRSSTSHARPPASHPPAPTLRQGTPMSRGRRVAGSSCSRGRHAPGVVITCQQRARRSKSEGKPPPASAAGPRLMTPKTCSTPCRSLPSHSSPPHQSAVGRTPQTLGSSRVARAHSPLNPANAV